MYLGLHWVYGDVTTTLRLCRHVIPGCLFKRGTSWQVHESLASEFEDLDGEDNRIQTQVRHSQA